jgi:hypothetical protein
MRASSTSSSTTFCDAPTRMRGMWSRECRCVRVNPHVEDRMRWLLGRRDTPNLLSELEQRLQRAPLGGGWRGGGGLCGGGAAKRHRLKARVSVLSLGTSQSHTLTQRVPHMTYYRVPELARRSPLPSPSFAPLLLTDTHRSSYRAVSCLVSSNNRRSVCVD